MIKTVIFLGVFGFAQWAFAKNSGELLTEASQWLGRKVSLDGRGLAHGTNCRVQVTLRPYTRNIVLPEILIRTFDFYTYEIKTSYFRYAVNMGAAPNSNECSVMRNDRDLQTACQWRECESQGCVTMAGEFSVSIEENRGVSFRIGEHECFAPNEPANGS